MVLFKGGSEGLTGGREEFSHSLRTIAGGRGETLQDPDGGKESLLLKPLSGEELEGMNRKNEPFSFQLTQAQ